MSNKTWLLSLCLIASCLSSPMAQAEQSITQQVDQAIKAYDQTKHGQSDNATCTHQLITLAENNIHSIGAEAACRWIIEHTSDKNPDFERALILYRKHFVDNSKIASGCYRLGYSDSKACRSLLRALLRSNHDANVQAFACLSLAELLQPGSPLKSRKLFTRLIEKYGQVKVPDANLTIADVAAPKLYELEHHARGMTAPDFEGRETNDNPMSLHDFRGKIVMLDFFGTWCGPCCSMFEHERSLVQKYPAEKFAILGVDCDDSREDLEKLEKDKTITWPCFFDGQRPSPIVTQWHVRAFPTTFILDKKGKIFSKIVGANLPAIDAAIEKLMSSHN